MADNFKDHLYALMVAGGGGTRLWPRSREKTPKQFLRLFNKRTLFDITAERLNKFLAWEKIFVITVSEDYAGQIHRLAPHIPKANVIVEPIRRDSAPAHGLGALYIYKKDSDAVIINAAVDHFVSPASNYKNTILAASRAAYGGDWLVAIGIKPTYPHTGYGYIKKGPEHQVLNRKRVFKLEKFVEKPPLPLAKKYMASGEYFWNANQFVWRADSFLKAVTKYAPDIWKVLERISKSFGTKKGKEVLEKEYENMPKISVEYAVCEKAKNFLMLVADYEWTDIGDWNEVWKNLSKDEYGNVIIDGEEAGGEVYNIDTSDALIQTNGRLIAVIDVDNVVVIDTKDALLICSKSKSQNVKKIVERLKEEGKKELL